MKYLLPLLLVALLLAGCNSNKDPLNQFRYAVNDSLIVAGRAGAMVLQEPLPPTLDNYSMETYEQVVMEEGIDVTYRYCTVKILPTPLRASHWVTAILCWQSGCSAEISTPCPASR